MKTVALYCSSNREKPEFEQKIRDNILKNCGGMEIISVTQKPIDFGKNICVGDSIGVSGWNFFRQILIGCESTDADFILSIEADCLYGPDYFQFTPPELDVCYRNSNLYCMAHKRAIFWKKPEGATHAQIVGREFYVKTLKKLFEGLPMWSATEKNFPKERYHKEDVFGIIKHWETENPVVQLKTSDSMRFHTTTDRIDRDSLQYWGRADLLRAKFIK